MDAIIGIVVLALFLLPTVFWIWALVDIIRSEFEGNNKVVWLLVVVFLPLLGIILYAIVGRKQKIQFPGVQQTGDKFCQTCGEKMPAFATLCTNCNSLQPAAKKSNNTVAVVVAICLALFVGVGFVGVLAAIAIPQFASYRVKGYDAAALSDLQSIKTGMNSYLADHEQFPSSINEITYTPSQDVEVVVRRLDAQGYEIITGHKKGSKWYMADSDDGTLYSAPMNDDNAEFLPMN